MAFDDSPDDIALRASMARYLDGVASASERAAVERALIDDAAAVMFAEELALRDLLRNAPPLEPPDALLARWQAAVGQAVAEAHATEAASGGWLGRALDALGWSVRGPAMTVTTAGAGPARTGLSTLRYGVPLPVSEPKPPLWRRLIGRSLSRRPR